MSLWIELLLLVVVVAVLVIALVVIGARKYRRATQAVVDRLVDSARPVVPSMSSVDSLPEPVVRYFRHVFVRQAQTARAAQFFQRGTLRVDPKAKRWSRFSATWTVSDDPPAFVWDARIELAPLLHVRVRDSLIDGIIGAGEVRLLSALPLGHDRDKPELNSGALYRYLAEAVWHPHALLPEAGVRWQAIDDEHASASLTAFGMTVTLEFRFNSAGEIVGVYTEDRFGRFDGKYIRYPWEGRFSDYREFDGVRIPSYGEVGWHLPDGWWLFWKGEIVSKV